MTKQILNKKNLKPATKQETIFETEHRLKQEAIELQKKHIDQKPIKYLLK